MHQGCYGRVTLNFKKGFQFELHVNKFPSTDAYKTKQFDGDFFFVKAHPNS